MNCWSVLFHKEICVWHHHALLHMLETFYIYQYECCAIRGYHICVHLNSKSSATLTLHLCELLRWDLYCHQFRLE